VMQALVSLQDMRGLRRALCMTDPWVRREAVKALSDLQGAAAARWLVRALDDEDRTVAHAAAECLASIAEPRLLWALRRCLGSEDWMVRYFGVMGLARLDAHHLRPLLEKLQHDDHSWVRGAAGLALRRLVQPPAG
jgi:HEAT repeat protein